MKTIINDLLAAACGVAIIACSVSASLAQGKTPATQPFTWKNPLSPNLRDPEIVVVDGAYYMTGTCPPFFEKLGQSPGVKIWQSKDLLHWDDGTVVIAPSKDSWYRARFWAPEIYHSPDDHKFYLTFNCPAGGENANTPQSIGLAVADAVMGPYRVTTEDKPLAAGNDTSIFRDDDGKTYIFRSGLTAFEVDLPHSKQIGASFQVLPKGPPGAWDGATRGAPAVGLEGPCVIKIGKTYYCFYSSWGRGYEVGYATADNVHGPWTRYVGNPIYGAQDEAWCKQYKHTYTGDRSSPYRQVGHNGIFIGPDGRYWICAHAYRIGEKVLQPHLVIDPLNFNAGVFTLTRPSFTPQSVSIDPACYPRRTE